jgi:hypothetical protein
LLKTLRCRIHHLLDLLFGKDVQKTLKTNGAYFVTVTVNPDINAVDMCSSAGFPPRLQGTPLVSLEVGSLVAGTKYLGEFEERLQAIVQEVTDPKAPPTILFIDEIHYLVGAVSVS